MKKIKTLLIGLGRIASKLELDPYRNHPCTHAGVLLSAFGKKYFSLEAVADTDPEKVFEFFKQWKIKNNSVISFTKLESSIDFDLAIIASNSESHYRNLEQVAKLGIKNILIEKPICLNENEFTKIKNLQKKFQLNLWINHERRYHPFYQYVKNRIWNKLDGELRTIKASVLTNFRDPGNAFKTFGGPLFHDGTHAIDFIDFLVESKPISIFSKLNRANKNSEVEEQALAVLEYKNGVNAFLEVGGRRNYFQFEIDVQTANARYILSNDGHKIFITKKSKLYKGFQSLQEIKIPSLKGNPWLNLYKEIESVINGKTQEITGSLSVNERIFYTLDQIQNLG